MHCPTRLDQSALITERPDCHFEESCNFTFVPNLLKFTFLMSQRQRDGKSSPHERLMLNYRGVDALLSLSSSLLL